MLCPLCGHLCYVFDFVFWWFFPRVRLSCLRRFMFFVVVLACRSSMVLFCWFILFLSFLFLSPLSTLFHILPTLFSVRPFVLLVVGCCYFVVNAYYAFLFVFLVVLCVELSVVFCLITRPPIRSTLVPYAPPFRTYGYLHFSSVRISPTPPSSWPPVV